MSTKGGDIYIFKLDEEQEICIILSHTVWLIISGKHHSLQNCWENNGCIGVHVRYHVCEK